MDETLNFVMDSERKKILDEISCGDLRKESRYALQLCEDHEILLLQSKHADESAKAYRACAAIRRLEAGKE